MPGQMSAKLKPRTRPHRRVRRPGVGLARALSKMGSCSRRRALAMISSGCVLVNGVVCQDAETPVNLDHDTIEVDGRHVVPTAKVYFMLNKPRGFLTTTADEKGRRTVYDCLSESNLPWLAPVGRLDKASEGLLLLSNDTQWAARIMAPESHLEKIYHVQIDCLANESLLRGMVEGVTMEDGDFLSVKCVRLLRYGSRNSWLEVVLDQGKNRHIRRLLGALGVNVLRLVRVAIGPLQLGTLAKGKCRQLSEAERRDLEVASAILPE
jgi:23S rRNA pseudouridine2605 synthase